jgi:hypothetical protein
MHNVLPRFIRLAFLPFPAAIAACFSVLTAADYYFRPDRSHIERAPLEGFATVFIVVLAGLLQLTWGAPSILALDRRGAGLRGYLGVGIASSSVFALLFAAILHAPKLGETLGWMFSYVLLFFGVPLSLSYLFALWLRRFTQQKPPNQAM